MYIRKLAEDNDSEVISYITVPLLLMLRLLLPCRIFRKDDGSCYSPDHASFGVLHILGRPSYCVPETQG